MNRHAFLRRNLGETVRAFFPLLVALTVGATALLATAGTVGRWVSRSATTLDTQSALSVLRLDSVNPSCPSKPLTEAAMQAIHHLQGVEDVRPYAQFAITVLSDGDIGTAPFWATPRISWVQPPLTRTVPGMTGDHRLTPGEIYLPDQRAGVGNAPLLGKSLRVQYTRATGPDRGEAAELTVRVVGLYDNSHPGGDGESAAYVGTHDFATLLNAQLGHVQVKATAPPGYAYPTVYVKLTSTRALTHVQTALAGMGYPAESPAARARDLPGLLRVASKLDIGLGVLLLVFCFGIGLSMGGTWSSLRRWDVGVLSSLGWSRWRILKTYMTELGAIGVSVAACSVALGCLGSAVLGTLLTGQTVAGGTTAMGHALPASPWLLTVAAGVPLALVLGSAPRVLRLTGLPPDAALRRRD